MHGWKNILSRLLHPLPVFFIVTALSTLVYTVPNVNQSYQSSTTSIFGNTTLILNILFPIATGFIAALGVWFGLSDLRQKTTDSDHLAGSEGLYTPSDRSKTITRNIPIPAMTFDLERKVTFLNPAASDLFNMEQLKNHGAVYQFINIHNLEFVLDDTLKGSTVEVNRTGHLPDSLERERTWKITGIPITRHGQVCEALFLMEDMTQLRMLEEELVRSEDRYRNIFNHAPCGIFFVDSHGNYLDANPAALEMLGYTLGELTSLSTRELSADADSRLRRLKETPGWIEEETRYLRKDGKVVDAELQSSSYQSGNNTYYIGITRDITARRELERSLSAAKTRLKAVLSIESRPLLLLDTQNRIANLNSAAVDLLDCSSEKLLGIPLGDLIDGDLPPLQDTSSAFPSPCLFHIPEGSPMNLSVIHLPLGQSGKSGSLLLLSAGPLPVSKKSNE